MGASLITKPTVEVVSLAEVKAHLRVDTTDHDVALAGYLHAARRWAQTYTRRVFNTQTWDITLDGWPVVAGEHRIDFPWSPVQSVTTISYVSDAGVTTTLPTTEYLVRGLGTDGLPYIVEAYEKTWPTVRSTPESVTVRFVAGYGSQPGDVPEEIRAAIMLHVEILFDRNPQNRTLLETARDALLDPYRVVRV